MFSLAFFSSCKLVTVYIMAKPKKTEVENYRIEKYDLRLIRKQGWAGPAWYGYEVRKKYLGIYGFKKYYWCNKDSIKNCIVRINENKLILDKCNNKLLKD